MKKRYIKDYVIDIFDNVNKIIKFTEGLTYEDFAKNDEKIYAVVRALEIIGESAKSIPKEVKKKYPNIPWDKIVGMRNKIAHEYFGIDVKIVWTTATKDILQLKEEMGKIIKDF